MEIFSMRKEGEEPIAHQKLQYTMAMYAYELASGETIQGTKIKSSTIKDYLLAAATLVMRFDKLGRDARKELNCKELCEAIQKVVAQVKRFEDVPDRCEAYTAHMHNELAQKIGGMHIDCLEVSLFDWFTIGYQNACRRNEWCQEKYKNDTTQFERSPRDEARAFVLSDITFYGTNKKKFTLDYALKNADKVMHVRIIYRFQKNGDHGQKKWQSRNTKRPNFCSIAAWIRIVDRYCRLKDKNITDKPLAIFYNNVTRRSSNIIAGEASQLIKLLAKITYDETDKELAKYSCHSLRVGACCSLYAAGFSEARIKFLLRWKSDCWMDYVRDMIVTTVLHNEAINSVDDMPLM